MHDADWRAGVAVTVGAVVAVVRRKHHWLATMTLPRRLCVRG